ncbi:hypothetical protein [Enterococcus faecalis]|uniref:hypothetical protein n=1 Tax=Enterococcus faecalis TaxID=1351 RepID=UPI003CC53E46
MNKKEILEAIEESRFAFLIASENCWIDRYDKENDMKKMKLRHLKDCKNMLINAKQDIFNCKISSYLEENITDLEEYQNLVEELYTTKLEELDLNIKNRA